MKHIIKQLAKACLLGAGVGITLAMILIFIKTISNI